MVLLLKIIGTLLCGVLSQVAAQYVTFEFYTNECYGPVLASYDIVGVDTYDCYDYPAAAHFVSVGDACGPSYCAGVIYCQAGAEVKCGETGGGCTGLELVGSGCFNVNTGFEPATFLITCFEC